jgi:hypothetical protein
MRRRSRATETSHVTTHHAPPIRAAAGALATRLPTGTAALLDDYPAVLRVRDKA